MSGYLALYFAVGLCAVAWALRDHDSLWAELSTYPSAAAFPTLVLGCLLVAAVWPVSALLTACSGAARFVAFTWSIDDLVTADGRAP